MNKNVIRKREVDSAMRKLKAILAENPEAREILMDYLYMDKESINSK